MPGIALATVMVLLALGLGNESAIRACTSKPCTRDKTLFMGKCTPKANTAVITTLSLSPKAH